MIHHLQPGDQVEDVTAARHGWPDRFGTVLKVNGPHVLVCYGSSGNKRAKLARNLRRLAWPLRPTP